MTENIHPQDLPVERTVCVAGPDPKLENAVTLTFARIGSLALVPRRFFEQSQQRTFTAPAIERIYRLGPGVTGSHSCLLYVLLDRGNEIHGVLWLQLDPFTAELSVYVFAVDADYDDGDWIRRVSKWLFAQPFGWDNLQPCIVWVTNQSEILERVGAMPSANHRMVITKEEAHA